MGSFSQFRVGVNSQLRAGTGSVPDVLPTASATEEYFMSRNISQKLITPNKLYYYTVSALRRVSFDNFFHFFQLCLVVNSDAEMAKIIKKYSADLSLKKYPIRKFGHYIFNIFLRQICITPKFCYTKNFLSCQKTFLCQNFFMTTNTFLRQRLLYDKKGFLRQNVFTPKYFYAKKHFLRQKLKFPYKIFPISRDFAQSSKFCPKI